MRTIFTFLLLALPGLINARTDAGRQLETPHYFIENVGQVTDQYGHARADIQYKIQGGKGLTVFISAGQLHYQFYRQDSLASSANAYNDDTSKQGRYDLYRMDVTLEGADTSAAVTSENQQVYYERYYTPPFDMKTGGLAHSYTRLTYKNIYPHIDWVLYIKEGESAGMEYDFVVHPGGNTGDIRLRYDGATELLQQAGAITARTPQGTVWEAPPVCYEQETGKRVESTYKINDNAVGILTDSYTGTLVIDPVLRWGSYFGGTYDDRGWCTASDTGNNGYLGGSTPSATNIATVGSYQATIGGVTATNGYLAKFNSLGQVQWATYIGGTQADAVYSICTNAGHIYVMGAISRNIATPGTYTQANPNSYIAAFNYAGQLQWATNTFAGAPFAMTSDAAGNVYFLGYTNVTSGIGTPGTYQSTSAGGLKNYLIKLNNLGQQSWGTYLEGSGIQTGTGNNITGLNAAIVLDAVGNIFIANSMSTAALSTTSSSFQSTPAGGVDVGLYKFTNSGQMVWETYYGGPGDDFAEGLACDQAGNVYLAGGTTSSTGIATTNAYQSNYVATPMSVVGYLSKWNATGQLLWATYDGSSNIPNTGVACRGNAVFSSGGDFVSSTNGQGFLYKFNANGQMQYVTHYGSSSFGATFSNGLSIAPFPGNLLYLGGFTNSNNNIATTGAYQTLLNTNGISSQYSDGFIQCYKIDTTVTINVPYRDTIVCTGSRMKLPVSSDTFAAGNVYLVQLSSASGSFASPTVIGTDTAVYADTIYYTIPYSVPSGNGYRIRVVATMPADTTMDDGVNIRVVNLQNALTSNSPVCLGDSIVVSTNLSYPAVTLQWQLPGGNLQYGQSVQRYHVGYADSGNYILTAFSSICSYKDTVHVSEKPIPATPTATSNSPVCVNATLYLSANCATSGVVYNWYGPAAYTALNTQNPVRPNVPANGSGNYTVTATANGCSSSATIPVFVDTGLGQPQVTITMAANNLCSGQTASFAATAINAGSSPSYQWKANGTNISGATASTYSTAILTDGVVITCAIVSNAQNCQASQNIVSNPITVHIIQVRPLAVTVTVSPANYNPGTQVSFTAITTGYYSNISFQWYKNGMAIPGATSSSYSSYTLNMGDRIYVLAKSTDPCLSPDSVATRPIALSVGGVQVATKDMVVYPNPATGNLILETEGIAGDNASYKVTDMAGRQLTTGNILNNKQGIDVSNLASGMYLLSVFTNGAIHNTLKFTVQ